MLKERKLLELKEKKNMENIAKQSAQDDEGSVRTRRGSYTLSSPIFESSLLPKISSTESSESDKDTVVDGPLSLCSVDSELNENDKSSKDFKNEIDKRSSVSALYDAEIATKVNYQLRELIDKQKQEYLKAMESLKNKFTEEQQELIVRLQSNVVPVTSTPLDASIVTCTDDEDFTEFKTCLQSQSQCIEEKTIVNEDDETKVRDVACYLIS